MRKRVKITGFDKIQVARKVTKLCLDKGWEPVTPILSVESFQHNGNVSHFCILEHKDYIPNKRWNRIWEQ